MPCYYPLSGWKARHKNPSGKRGIVFNAKDGFADMPVELACGRCIGCRLERSKQWAIRCVHESQLHRENSFVTLTYDDNHLPHGGSLVKSHHQKFMKRLRARNPGRTIRYFHCGEYGDQSDRPHYHTILFGYDFADKIQYAEEPHPLYISESLQQLWPYGHCTIGAVTFETAAYVARYSLKKVTGDKAEDHYTALDPYTGELHKLEPEYVTMSRRPGIGKRWYDKFKDDVYPEDEVVLRGRVMRPPRFYDHLFESEGGEAAKRALVALRKERARAYAADQTRERLQAREKVAKAKLKTQKRTI